MVVDIFVTKGDRNEALSDKVTLLMNGEALVAWIVNDLMETFGELEFLIDFWRRIAPASEVSLVPLKRTSIFLFLAGRAVKADDFMIHSVWSFVGKNVLRFYRNLFGNWTFAKRENLVNWF